MVEVVDALPMIGSTIAANVAELVDRGNPTVLEWLEGKPSPEGEKADMLILLGGAAPLGLASRRLVS